MVFRSAAGPVAWPCGACGAADGPAAPSAVSLDWPDRGASPHQLVSLTARRFPLAMLEVKVSDGDFEMMISCPPVTVKVAALAT